MDIVLTQIIILYRTRPKCWPAKTAKCILGRALLWSMDGRLSNDKIIIRTGQVRGSDHVYQFLSSTHELIYSGYLVIIHPSRLLICGTTKTVFGLVTFLFRRGQDLTNIKGVGYTRVEMSFTGSLNVKHGHAILHIDKYDEDYLIPFPDCKIKGFLSGKLYPELSGTYHIISSTGFVSEIKFSGQGVFFRHQEPIQS